MLGAPKVEKIIEKNTSDKKINIIDAFLNSVSPRQTNITLLSPPEKLLEQ